MYVIIEYDNECVSQSYAGFWEPAETIIIVITDWVLGSKYYVSSVDKLIKI